MYLLPLSTGFTFPDDSKSEEEKSLPKFGADVGRAFYSRFCLGGTFGWGYNDVSGLRTIRDYGDGVQPESIYREWFTNGSPIGGGANAGNIGGTTTNNSSNGQASRHSRLLTTQMRAAMANISYRPYNPIPKFSSTVISMLSENDYRVECISAEQGAIDKKTKEKLRILYASTIINPLAKELGLTPVTIPFEPQSEEELEMMDKRGMFKNDIERALEKIGETGFNISNWKGNIRRKTNKDGIDFNFRCAKIFTEPTGAVKIRYVDVTKMVVLWNDNQTEPVAIGDIVLVDIQSIFGKLVRAGYTESEIKAIANTYRGQQIEQWANDSAIFERKDPVTGKWTWLDFKVPVLEFDYLSTDYSQYVKGFDKNGKKFYKRNEVPLSDKDKSKDREYDDFECNYWYEGCYIIGTDKVYEWRKKPNQIHGSKLNPMSSYVFDKAIDNGQALTQRAIALADDLMFAVLKKRAAVWAAAPKGYDVDLSEVGNIKIGGNEYSAFDLIHMHRQNGIRFKASRMNAATGKITSAPITELENGLGKQGQEWLNEISACTYMIGDVFGITDATSAQPNTESEKAVGIWEGEINATNHAIFPLKESDREFKAKVAAKYILQVRINIKYDNKCREFYENQVGSHIIGVLDSIDHISLEGLGIVMKAMPTKKQKDQIMARAVEMSKIATRDGSTYLTPADVEKVSELLEADDIDGARYYMYQRETYNRAEAERLSTQAIQQNGQVQQQSAQVVEQAKQQTAAMQSQLDLAKIEAQKNANIEELRAKYEFETPSKIAQIEVKADREDAQIDKEIAGELITGENIKNNRAA